MVGEQAATIVVGLGGSATTDGGAGALEVIEAAGGLGDVELVGACDVDVGFVEAATRFGPQKGAGPDQIAELEARLESMARRYEDTYGVDVRSVEGAGAAGGFGGAIVALGGRLRSGYEVVADLLGLAELMRESRLVVTGERGPRRHLAPRQGRRVRAAGRLAPCRSRAWSSPAGPHRRPPRRSGVRGPAWCR